MIYTQQFDKKYTNFAFQGDVDIDAETQRIVRFNANKVFKNNVLYLGFFSYEDYHLTLNIQFEYDSDRSKLYADLEKYITDVQNDLGMICSLNKETVDNIQNSVLRRRSVMEAEKTAMEPPTQFETF